MSRVIKGGTVVTADRTFKADVLIEDETIKAIESDLSGDEYVDAEGAYVMPGGIDPHTHLEMPFMGTTAAETFESGTWAAAAGGTTMLVDFCLPDLTVPSRTRSTNGTASPNPRSARMWATTWRSQAGTKPFSTK